jgi:uncharacterized protein (TIGR04255 family)
MPLNFPRKEEIQLTNPPLGEVICQVRMPTILLLAKEEPSDFQELIRDRFPQLEVEQGVRFQLPGPGSQNTPSVEARPNVFRFRSMDDQTAISLTMDFYALSTHNYKGWTDFAKQLTFAHNSVMRLYKPPYATRIGLRYINRLTLENSGCQSAEELFDLLRPEITTLLRGEVWQDTENMMCQLAFSDEEARLNLRLAFEQRERSPSFVLDFDYFESGKLPLADLIERCNRYHEIIYDGFRWCILDESLTRFQPIMD